MPQPTPDEMRKISRLVPHSRGHCLQLMSRHPLLVVTSTLRSVVHNAEVGGVPNSWHLKGRAVDFVAPDFDLRAAADDAWRLRLGPNCTGPEEVLLEYLGSERAHLHVAW